MAKVETKIQSSLISVIRRLNDRLEGKGLEWAIVGSFGLAIRGATIVPRDIDIMTNKVGAYEIERMFSKHVVSPVSLKSNDMIKSHFGELDIDGVKVEIMGDFQIRLNDGSWQKPPDLANLIEIEPLDELCIPVLSLEWEFDSYSKLGRVERAETVKGIMIDKASVKK